jgi:hypothetical protein
MALSQGNAIRVESDGKERKQNCSQIVVDLLTFFLRVLITLYPFPVRNEHRIYFFFGAMRSVMVPSNISGGKRNCLRQSRVRVNGQAGVPGIRPTSRRQHRLGDQVAGVWADDAAASRRLVASSNSSLVTPSSGPSDKERPLAAHWNTPLRYLTPPSPWPRSRSCRLRRPRSRYRRSMGLPGVEEAVALRRRLGGTNASRKDEFRPFRLPPQA